MPRLRLVTVTGTWLVHRFRCENAIRTCSSTTPKRCSLFNPDIRHDQHTTGAEQRTVSTNRSQTIQPALHHTTPHATKA